METPHNTTWTFPATKGESPATAPLSVLDGLTQRNEVPSDPTMGFIPAPRGLAVGQCLGNSSCKRTAWATRLIAAKPLRDGQSRST